MVYLGDLQILIHYVIKVSQYLDVFNKYGIQLYSLANHNLPYWMKTTFRVNHSP